MLLLSFHTSIADITPNYTKIISRKPDSLTNTFVSYSIFDDICISFSSCCTPGLYCIIKVIVMMQNLFLKAWCHDKNDPLVSRHNLRPFVDHFIARGKYRYSSVCISWRILMPFSYFPNSTQIIFLNFLLITTKRWSTVNNVFTIMWTTIIEDATQCLLLYYSYILTSLFRFIWKK